MSRLDFHEKFGISLEPLRELHELKPRGIMAFDVETKDGLIAKELFCWSLSFKNQKNEIETKTVVVKGKQWFFNELFDLISMKEEKRRSMARIIYVHNLGFESRYIIDYLARQKIPYNDVITGSSVISIYIPSINAKFVDSYQFLQSSQKQAEIDYNIPEERRKIDCVDIFNKNYKEWSKLDKQRLKEHNKFDVINLLDIMLQFRQTMYEVANVDVCQTISLASLGMKAFRKSLETPINNPSVFKTFNTETNRIELDYEKHTDEFIRKSYKGGRTEVYDLNIHKNVSVLDKVSMYPGVMKYEKYPKGFGEWKYESKEDLTKYLKNEQYEGFMECYAKPTKNLKYPILPATIDNKLMFVNCELKNVFTFPELRYAIKYGYEIEPIKALVFSEKEDYFTPFVDKFFKIKSESKGGKKKCAKILLNSVYGKFAQAFEMKNCIYHYAFTEKEAIENSMKYPNAITKQIDESDMAITIESVNCKIVKPFMNVGIASYITSYARIELHKLLTECERLTIDVYNSDTDSIFIDSSEVNKIKIGRELGAWDLDKTLEEFKAFAPKAYAYKENGILHLKLKGVDKMKIEEIVSKCNSVDEIEQIIRKEINLNEKYMSIKEAHRFGNIIASKKITKIYTYENQKRNFVNGISTPWNIATIPEKMKEFVK